MRKTESSWRTVDFRPAPPGWRAIYLVDEGPGYLALPMPGWLIQAEVIYDAQTFEDIETTEYRRVVAADLDGADLVEVDADNFWHLLAPGAPDPTPKEVQEVRAERQQAAAERTRRDAAKKAT